MSAQPAAEIASLSRHPRPGPELTVVIPTLNESENVAELVRRLDASLAGTRWEAIFVDDDSADGTAERVRELSRHDNRIRGIQRIGRRGLSSACIEGMLSSSAPYLAVMDGDLQHDEKLLPEMLRLLRGGDLDVVIGSRFAPGGDTGGWDPARLRTSRFAARLSRIVLKSELSDPMSGFFMMRREAFHDAVRGLSGIGFKILLDLLASSPQPLRCREVPYRFGQRQAGQSKLDSSVAWNYGILLLDKLVGHIVPVRFVSFGLVGAVGVAVHLGTQAVLLSQFLISFPASQAIATLVAMTSNFAINNLLTYRDVRLRGVRWLKGWISFCLVCSIGAAANVGIASYIYHLDARWVLAAVAGILVSAVWNYAVTGVYTWRRR